MRRIPELDGVRGFAALGVVLHHANPERFFLGWACVDAFFVLSGFLITTIILNDGANPGFFRRFYQRRILRIWPVYYLTLLAVVALSRFDQSASPLVFGELFRNAVFLQNLEGYFGTKIPGFLFAFTPSWSVAIEEQYYLVWPLIVWMFGRRVIPLAAGLLIAISLTLRFQGIGFFLLFTRGDGLALGCLLAWMSAPNSQSHSQLQSRWVRGGIGVGFVVGLIGTSFLTYAAWRDPEPPFPTVAFLLVSLLAFGLIGLSVSASGHPWLSPLRFPVARGLGTISYSLYLFHLPIMTYFPPIMQRIGIRSPDVQWVLVWIAVFGIPALSWIFLERPLLHGARSRPRSQARSASE